MKRLLSSFAIVMFALVTRHADERFVLRYDAPHILELLLALPLAWSKGGVSGLCASGVLAINLEREPGHLTPAPPSATRDSKFRTDSLEQLRSMMTFQQGVSQIWNSPCSFS
jgi:hypothetical protein